MKSKAQLPNPALAPLEHLIGEWNTTGTHPAINEEVHGRVEFEWLEGGAFLKMTATITHPDFPDGVALFSTDDNKTGHMLYFDERGVSRKYDFSFTHNELKWWRDDPKFAQRFTVTIECPGQRMVGKGQMRQENAPWEGDLNLTFDRA